jgi:hypothetical protein
MIHTGKLDVEQFIEDIEIEVFSYLYDNGYPVDDIEEAHAVVSEKKEENTGHIVLRIQTLTKPLNEADATTDQTTKWVCDCKAFQFHHSVDLEERYLSEWDSCKHINAVSKVKKAQADENQDTLL